VLPKIKKVISAQHKIDLSNGEDTLIGFADMVCLWEEEQEAIVFDYKTSSIEYAEDSVKISSQLTLYAHALGLKRAGYLVFRKGILKNRVKICGLCGNDGSGSRHKTCAVSVSGVRCNGEWLETIKPEVDIQIIVDNIPEQTDNIVLSNVEEINKAIKAGIFIRNFDSCKKPWGNCAYMDLCFKNSKEGLEQQ
jgi:hypothetical protein